MKLKAIIIMAAISGIILSIWFMNKSNPSMQHKDQDIPIRPIDAPNQPISGASEGREAGSAGSGITLRSVNNEPPKRQDYMTEKQLINIALEEARKGVTIPNGTLPTVTYRGDVAEIVWPMEWPPDKIMPSGDYYALVEINRNSGKIIKILASP